MSSAAPSLKELPEQHSRAGLAAALRRAALQRRTVPLSSAQRRLWFLDQLEPGNPRYNVPVTVRLTGPLDVAALEQAFIRVIARHEILRARFMAHDGAPVQVIESDADFRLRCEDLTRVSEEQQPAAVRRLIQQESQRPFNLSSDRLLRATLLRTGPHEHVLLLNVHHIVFDEWSSNILWRELAAFYQGEIANEWVALPDLPIQYADYALWQQEWLRGPICRSQLEFWKQKFASPPPPIALPADHCRADGANTGAAWWRALGSDLSNAIKEMAVRERTTLFMVLLAGFKAMLHRRTRQEDLTIGSPVAGRNRIETEGLIGLFVNTLPLRTQVNGELSFYDLLTRVRETVLGAFSHGDLPFDRLIEALHADRSAGQTPLINTMFVLQTAGNGGLKFPGLDLHFFEAGVETAKFDLTLTVYDTSEGLTAVALYDPSRFDASTMERLLEHYHNLLAGAVANPEIPLRDLPLLSDTERRKVLVDWNQTRAEYPRCCVHEIFEEQARARPQAIAVSCGDSRRTYGELNARANQLAHYLREQGVARGSVVAVCLERSPDMIVALLGILKASAACAPLDPASPRERIAKMLEDLRPTLVITQRDLSRLVSPSEAQAFRLDADWDKVAGQPTGHLRCEAGPEDVAYISFTSGSTGRPKGVCVPHRGIVRLVKNNPFAEFSSDEVFLQLGPISFDASSFEIWGSLLNGGRLVLAPPQLPSLSELAILLERQGVTTAWLTAGLFNQIIEEMPEALRPLRQLLTGGDVLSPPHIRKALDCLPGCRIINGYGPTENATFTTTYAIPREFDGRHSVPIGRPIANSECYVLDEHLQPVPIGTAGELHVGGDGLAAGYLNRPELTAERFIDHPFRPGARLYKTGDLVRYLPDGNLEFLGRIDSQVKIRGYRVEPGEVEMRLLQHPAVRQCAVIARADRSGTRQLAAYFVPDTDHEPSSAELRDFVRQHLPEYMVPAFFVSLRALPLSATGKVDRRSLPEPGITVESTLGCVPPADDVESKLQQIWQNVLGVCPIGVHDEFFSLGGHSLLAVRLAARVEKVFAKKLPVAAVFSHPTIRRMAALLRDEEDAARSSSIVRIQPRGSRPPLFLVHGAGGGMFWGYGNLARHMGEDQPVLAFSSRGLRGQSELETIGELAESYLADLRAVQPRGPYRLGGYCFGGLVAYEMAHRLQAAGEKIGLLALINSMPPNSGYTRFRWTPLTAGKFAANVCLKTAYSLPTSAERWAGLLRWKLRVLMSRYVRFLNGFSLPPTAPNPEEFHDLSQYSEAERRVWEVHIQALLRYRPPVSGLPVTLFRSPLHLLYSSFAMDYGWSEFARGGVTVRVIPGAHDNIMEEPRVRVLSEEICAALLAT